MAGGNSDERRRRRSGERGRGRVQDRDEVEKRSLGEPNTKNDHENQIEKERCFRYKMNQLI